MHALDHHGLDRVAVVDFDVHHDNRTEDVFAGDERVLMVSTFQHPLCPYSGFHDPAPNAGRTCRCRKGAGSQGSSDVIRRRWRALLGSSRRSCSCRQASTRIANPLARLRLTDADYAWVTRPNSATSPTSTPAGASSRRSGGYSLSALGRSAAGVELIAG